MLCVDRCRYMNKLINFFSPIRTIVRMPEPDCFLRYRISAGRGILRRENLTYAYWRGPLLYSEAWF